MRIASLFKLSSAAFLSSVIGAVSVLGVSSIAQAQDQFFKDGFLSEVNWQVEPYIGADAMTRVMRYKNEPTHPFQEHLDTFQPFVGVRLHKYFGIEAGYQKSEKGTKERFFNPNETPSFFGGGPMRLQDPAPFFAHLDINTTTSVKGWNVGVVGFYPICKDKTELFAKIAYSDLSLDTEYRFNATIHPNPLPQDLGFAGIDYGHLHDSTSLINLTIGLKQAFSRNLAGRVFVNFDRTSRLRLDSTTTIIEQLNNGIAVLGGVPIERSNTISIRPHNSWSFGVGLFYTWK